MKNLKKIIAMGLTAALCAVSLAGCGGTQNGGTDGATDTNAKDTYKIGVGFNFQIVDELKQHENDINLDTIITNEIV